MIDSTSVAIIEFLFIATVVIVALLAGLITVGLERQKKELALIRGEIEGWAVADLELKRAELAPSVKVDDPLRWLSEVATRATGAQTRLVSLERPESDAPLYILAKDETGAHYYFSATTPDGLRRYRAPSRMPWASRLQRAAIRHPLVPLSRETQTYKLSNLNCGLVFDLEAAQVWKSQLKENLVMQELWLYAMPAGKEK